MKQTKTNTSPIERLKIFYKDNYFIVIPTVVTICIYFVSLFFEFRNFDEDIIIKNFYMKKSLPEYMEKYFLLDLKGITEARGSAFSGVENFHFCLIERPLFYIVNFLFQSKPFLFHLLGLSLHLISTAIFSLLCFNLTGIKIIAFFSSLIWATHPTNVEPVIWATNWPPLTGITIYFFTLYTIAINIDRNKIDLKLLLFIFLMTIIQTQIVEHTITIPFTIFMLVLYKLQDLRLSSKLKTALKVFIPSFIPALIYITLRSLITNGPASSSMNFKDHLARICFLSPQVFFHELKLIFFPKILSIDHLDQLVLDSSFLGPYHFLCLSIIAGLIILAFFLYRKATHMSFGLMSYLIIISPFIHIVPLYSICAERYNYLASSFLIFSIIAILFFALKRRFFMIVAVVIFFVFFIRSSFRIHDWQNSSTLFQSTIESSRSFYKKGIWTYNLALSQNDEEKKKKLIIQSTKFLKAFINNPTSQFNLEVLKNYALDKRSLVAKAYIRISTNYEILGNRLLQLKYLNKSLNLTNPDSRDRSLVYKNLATYYFQNNDYKTAINYYKKSNITQHYPSTYFAIAACYLKLNDLVNYEKYLKMAIAKTPSNGRLFLAYGQFLELEKKKYTEAIKNYKIASILEDSPEPYILLGTLHLKLNQIDNAHKVIQDGLYGHPDNPHLLYLRGAIYINKGQTKIGVKDMEEVVTNPKSQSDLKKEAYTILKRFAKH